MFIDNPGVASKHTPRRRGSHPLPRCNSPSARGCAGEALGPRRGSMQELPRPRRRHRLRQDCWALALVINSPRPKLSGARQAAGRPFRGIATSVLPCTGGGWGAGVLGLGPSDQGGRSHPIRRCGGCPPPPGPGTAHGPMHTPSQACHACHQGFQPRTLAHLSGNVTGVSGRCQPSASTSGCKHGGTPSTSTSCSCLNQSTMDASSRVRRGA